MSADPDRGKVVDLPVRGPADEEIVRGLRAGDPRASSALFDRYGPMINRLVWRLLGMDSEHDDVVHQVFVSIFSSLHRIDNAAALRSWIGGLTINTVRKELRNRKYRRRLSPVGVVEGRSEGDEELARSFYRAVEAMGPDERIAFVLRYVEGRSLAEVAASVDCSLATAKRRIARAKEIFVEQARSDAALSSAIEDMKDEG